MDKTTRIGDKVEASVAGEHYIVYVPKPLPPSPALVMEGLYPLIDRANIALGRLDGVSHSLPDPELFLYLYIRKEAVLSSQIEGTQSSLSDLLTYENHEVPGVPEDDVVEVSNYVAAMEYGLKRLRQDDFPLSLRLMKEIHAVLMKGRRGSSKQPGEFRQSQNWIGGTRPGNAKFVPPSPDRLIKLLGDLELFLHDDKCLPVLVKAALAHVQFETIHPFLDGNGRLGRLLITFILCCEGLLSKPMLYLSLYFKTFRQEYYEQLQSVRETGDWERWVAFFLEGVVVTSQQAVDTAHRVMNLLRQDRESIEKLGRSAGSALMIFHALQKYPVNNIAKLAKQASVTVPTASKALRHLCQLGVIEEITGKGRDRLFKYSRYLDTLNDGIGNF
ncbi:MAG: Fic family protein [Coxiellaceae bacterium]|nr:Fic family protein [Coxiellaceae bacterium]